MISMFPSSVSCDSKAIKKTEMNKINVNTAKGPFLGETQCYGQNQVTDLNLYIFTGL